MKIKSINRNTLLDNCRYDNYIETTYIEILESEENNEKREYGSIVIFSLMDICGLLKIDNERYEVIHNEKNLNSLEKNSTNNKFHKNNIIVFSNGKYRILDIVNINNNTYLYLINEDKYMDNTCIKKIKNTYENIELINIIDDQEFNEVLYELFLDFEDDIKMFAIND